MVSNPNVSISRVTNSIPDAVRQVVDLLGGMRRFVKKGDRVIVKPNLAYPYPPPATTDPRVVEAVATLCAEAGAGAVWIGDSTSYSCKDILGAGKWNNRDVIEQTGMEKAAVNAGASVLDFDLEPWKLVRIADGIVLKKVEIAAAMLAADVVINVPVMKTHFECLVTLGIKNYHGIIPDHYKIQFHKDDIHQKLVDIHKVVKTDLTIMDGLLAMEGTGPRMGSPVEMNLVLAANDVVAMDAVCSEIMGINADEVETTRLAAVQGIGVMDLAAIEILGERIESVKRNFARPDVRIAGLYPGITVLQGGPCLHCYGRARTFLDTLRQTGIPDNAGISTLLVGIKPPNPELEDVEGDVVFVGDCALEGSTNLRYALGKRAHCMQGCPPIPSLHMLIDKLKESHPQRHEENDERSEHKI